MKVLAVEPWSLPEAVEEFAEMQRRLCNRRPPRSMCAGWSGGIDQGFLDRLCTFLSKTYSWDADRARFGGRHLMVHAAPTDGNITTKVHVTLPYGVVAGAEPLVLLHGWPSSSFEFVHVVRGLAGQAIFPVLIDLPGFGFSEPTPEPLGPRAMASMIASVLGDGLGLEAVMVHGNDWGSTVASWLAIDYPDLVVGLHLSMMGLQPDLSDGSPEPDEAERAWMRMVRKRLAADAGYREIQSTKPNTVAVGLSDSPAALAAWIAEKFHGWTTGPDVAESKIAIDDIAAVVTAYWLAGTISSANWIYSAVRASDDTAAPASGTGSLPVGLSFFGEGFFPPPPISWPRRIHRVVSHEVHESGGHYPALTSPDVLCNDLLRFCTMVLDGRVG